MNAPIYHPQADRPSDAVLAAEAKLLQSHGHFHVGQLYFASAADAAIVRRLQAERMVEAEERHAKLVCAFCFERIGQQVAVVIAMRPVHQGCAERFDKWIADHPSENDPRWMAVTASTLVEFEGEMTTWGTLAGNERTCCEFDGRDQLVGRRPL